MFFKLKSGNAENQIALRSMDKFGHTWIEGVVNNCNEDNKKSSLIK